MIHVGDIMSTVRVLSAMWVFNIVGDITINVGDILSIVGGVQYRGGYHEYRRGVQYRGGIPSFVI